MKMRRRIFALCLVLCMLVGMTPAWAMEAHVSGTCGEKLAWTLDTNGTLTISGRGKMGEDYSPSAPWSDYSDDIKTVVIFRGV